MANLDKKISMPELSAANQQTPVGAGRWFDWIRRWIGRKNYRKECGDNNNRYVADAPEMDEMKESRDPSIAQNNITSIAQKNLCTDWVLVEPKIRPPSPDHSQQYVVVHGNYERMKRKLNIQRANVGWNSILQDRKSEPDRETKCPDLGKITIDTSIATIQNQQVKHDSVDEELNNDREKEIRTLTDLCNQNSIDNKLKEEENILMKNELCELRDNVHLMEQKLKNIDDTLSTQNLKVNNTLKKLHVYTEKVAICSANRNIETENMYENMNNRIKKLVLIVDSLISERNKFINLIGDMTRQINSNKRKHTVYKKYFNKGKGYIKKDLVDVKKHLYSLEMQVDTANKVVANNMKTQNIDRLKYDKLKTRMSMIEKAEVNNQILINQIRAEQIQQNRIMSSACLRGGANDSMRNVHNKANGQKIYSPSPVPPTIPMPPQAPPLPITVDSELPVVDSESPVVLPAPPAHPLPVIVAEIPVVDSESMMVPQVPSAPLLPVTVAELLLVDSKSPVILPAQPAQPLPVNVSELPVVDSVLSVVSPAPSTPLLPVTVAELQLVDSESPVVPPSPPAPLLSVIVAESPVLDSELPVAPQAPLERPLGIIDPEFPIVHLEPQAPSTESPLEPPVEIPLLSIDVVPSVVPPAVIAVLPLTLVVPELPAVHNSL